MFWHSQSDEEPRQLLGTVQMTSRRIVTAGQEHKWHFPNLQDSVVGATELNRTRGCHCELYAWVEKPTWEGEEAWCSSDEWNHSFEWIFLDFSAVGEIRVQDEQEDY
jgi:hypothetical protein